jgi:hypothetical protein
MLHGHRVSGQVTGTRGDGTCGRNTFANIGNQFITTQIACDSASARRTDFKKLEEFTLRKDGGRRTVYSDQQAVSIDIYTQHRSQAQQDDGYKSLEP